MGPQKPSRMLRNAWGRLIGPWRTRSSRTFSSFHPCKSPIALPLDPNLIFKAGRGRVESLERIPLISLLDFSRSFSTPRTYWPDTAAFLPDGAFGRLVIDVARIEKSRHFVISEFMRRLSRVAEAHDGLDGFPCAGAALSDGSHPDHPIVFGFWLDSWIREVGSPFAVLSENSGYWETVVLSEDLVDSLPATRAELDALWSVHAFRGLDMGTERASDAVATGFRAGIGSLEEADEEADAALRSCWAGSRRPGYLPGMGAGPSLWGEDEDENEEELRRRRLRATGDDSD